MRVILFRGKQIHNGVWAEGSLIRCGDGSALIAISKSAAFIASKTVVTLDNAVDVDPKTVGQFTGETETLCDAEGNLKSGNKIFDGDILEVYSSEWENSAWYLVYWDEESLGWHRKYLRGPHIADDEIDSIKIIGNIHDNPELLEAAK